MHSAAEYDAFGERSERTFSVSVRDYQVAARGDRKTAARAVTSSSRVLYFESRRSARR